MKNVKLKPVLYLLLTLGNVLIKINKTVYIFQETFIFLLHFKLNTNELNRASQFRKSLPFISSCYSYRYNRSLPALC